MNYLTKNLKNKKSFDYMVSVWLKDEWHSDAFIPHRGNQELEKIIKTPDLTNEIENQKRKELIMMARGRQLEGLPSDTEWFEIDFGVEDLARAFLIPVRAEGWTYEITRGTLSIVDAVENLKSASELIKNSKHTRDYNSIEDIGKHLDSVNKEIILLASSPESRFTVIEGNHRAIALAQALMLGTVQNFTVILGVSPAMKDYEFSVEKWRS